MSTLTEAFFNLEAEKERAADLLARHWGLGKPLNDEQKDALLNALDEENRAIDKSIHARALERLRARGIK